MNEQMIERRLAETANMIEAAVGDIKSNMATKAEVLSLIDERTKADKELLAKARADLDQINSGMTEAATAIKTMQQQVRNFKAASSFAVDGQYRGHFAGPREAKAFALLVMAATMGGDHRLKDRHDAVCKQLDALGIDPYWVDANGRKTMVGSSQAGGGALVGVEQIPSIIMLLERYGVARRYAQAVPMGAGQTTQPKIDGLLTVTCPGEGNETTAQDPVLKTVGLFPRTLTALTAFSMELEDDSLVPLGEMLAGLFARSFAYAEDRAMFLGDGTSTYFGFKGIVAALRAVDATIGNIKSLVVGAGNAYSELTLPNFTSVVGMLPEFADDGEATWFCHRYFFWTVMVSLALAAGSGTATEILTGQATGRRTYLSYPVQFTQVMPKTEANSQICALLANLRQGAMLGTRGGIEFATSDQRYFEKGLVAVRGRDRVAINVHGVGDTTNPGPICGLITAAA